MLVNMQTIQDHALRKPRFGGKKASDVWSKFASLTSHQQETLLWFIAEEKEGLYDTERNDPTSSSQVVLLSLYFNQHRWRRVWEALRRFIALDVRGRPWRRTLFIVLARTQESRREGPRPLLSTMDRGRSPSRRHDFYGIGLDRSDSASSPFGSRNQNGSIDPVRPTYIKVHHKDLSPDTLNTYRLPWEWCDEERKYIIIKRWISQRDQEILFKHTRRLRRKILRHHDDRAGDPSGLAYREGDSEHHGRNHKPEYYPPPLSPQPYVRTNKSTDRTNENLKLRRVINFNENNTYEDSTLPRGPPSRKATTTEDAEEAQIDGAPIRRRTTTFGEDENADQVPKANEEGMFTKLGFPPKLFKKRQPTQPPGDNGLKSHGTNLTDRTQIRDRSRSRSRRRLALLPRRKWIAKHLYPLLSISKHLKYVLAALFFQQCLMLCAGKRHLSSSRSSSNDPSSLPWVNIFQSFLSNSVNTFFHTTQNVPTLASYKVCA